MGKRRARVYCAGPLFNVKEREEMLQIADLLQDAGFGTFLPQRDGLELTKCVEALKSRGLGTEQATGLMSRAIFSLDVYQVVVGCDAIVVNLNGRVPDEGAVSEAAIAWCSGKAVVGYKADGRSVFFGQDNPLVAGLFDFAICDSLSDIVATLKRSFVARPTRTRMVAWRRRQLKTYLSLGERLSDALGRGDRVESVAEILSADRSLMGGLAVSGNTRGLRARGMHGKPRDVSARTRGKR
jgi:nucleoside 2-deoxyribosyltransferase